MVATMDIKFSFIIPVYNINNFLEKCLTTLIEQRGNDIEIIVVDDGSTDGSSNICDAFSKKDKRIRVFHKENGGLVSARKYGMSMASGEYVSFVDGDDWISDNYIDNFRRIVEKYSPEIICCSFFDSYPSNDVPNLIFSREGLYSKKEIESEIFPYLLQKSDGTYFTHSIWAKMFKKDLYSPFQEKVDSKITIGEDAACVIPLITKATRIFITKKCLYYYRHNISSMTNGKKVFAWQNVDLIKEHFESNLDLDLVDFRDQYYRFMVRRIFLTAISQFYLNEKYRITKKTLVQSLSNYDSIVGNAHFSSLKFSFISRVLKKKNCFVLRLLSVIRQRKFRKL